MSTKDLYASYKLPLRIEVAKTSFSHPENFVKRSSKKGEPTNIEDGEGSWMNAGAGGESNTVDLSLVLKDSDGKKIDTCDIIPIRVKLWCTENGLVVEGMKDEVSQATEQDRSGHRRGDNNCIMVSGKASSSLHINHDGQGFVCVRITTTSQLNERRRFTIEVAPDFSLQSNALPNLRSLFGEHECKPGDTTLSNRSLSVPIEVMSKINKLSKMRGGQDSFRQAQVHLEKALSILTEGVNKHGSSSESVPQLLTMCKHISNLLGETPVEQSILAREAPSFLIDSALEAYEKSAGESGLFDLNMTEANLLEELVNIYTKDPKIFEKLPKCDNTFGRPW